MTPHLKRLEVGVNDISRIFELWLRDLVIKMYREDRLKRLLPVFGTRAPFWL